MSISSDADFLINLKSIPILRFQKTEGCGGWILGEEELFGGQGKVVISFAASAVSPFRWIKDIGSSERKEFVHFVLIRFRGRWRRSHRPSSHKGSPRRSRSSQSLQSRTQIPVYLSDVQGNSLIFQPPCHHYGSNVVSTITYIVKKIFKPARRLQPAPLPSQRSILLGRLTEEV